MLNMWLPITCITWIASTVYLNLATAPVDQLNYTELFASQTVGDTSMFHTHWPKRHCFQDNVLS